MQTKKDKRQKAIDKIVKEIDALYALDKDKRDDNRLKKLISELGHLRSI